MKALRQCPQGVMMGTHVDVTHPQSAGCPCAEWQPAAWKSRRSQSH